MLCQLCKARVDLMISSDFFDTKGIRVKMSDNQHDLANEFPQYKDKIHSLKTENAHFRKLFDEYHELNKRIGRLEQRIELATQQEEEQVRKSRLVVKDELYKMLAKEL